MGNLSKPARSSSGSCPNRGEARQQRALRLIAASFIALAGHLPVQAGVVLATEYHPRHRSLGIAWTALTVAIMFALAVGKRRTGRGLGNPVLLTESRVTVIDGPLAGAVLHGLLLNNAVGWWRADAAAGPIIAYYAIRQAQPIYARAEYRARFPRGRRPQFAMAAPGTGWMWANMLRAFQVGTLVSATADRRAGCGSRGVPRPR